MNEITFDEWEKIKMKVGIIKGVERVPRTEKLYKLQVDIGEDQPRQILSSLVPYYKEEELLNKKIIVLTNLKPAKFSGEISQGMVLCAEKDDESECVLLGVEKDIAIGTRIT